MTMELSSTEELNMSGFDYIDNTSFIVGYVFLWDLLTITTIKHITTSIMLYVDLLAHLFNVYT